MVTKDIEADMKKSFSILGILVFVLLFLPIDVKAANTVTIKQIDSSTNSVTLECEVYSSLYSYCVINAYADAKHTMLLNTTSFVVPNAKVRKEIADLPSASTVYLTVGFGKSYVDAKPTWVNQAVAVTAIDDFEGTFKQTKAGASTAVVEVSKVYGATKYIYSLYDSNDKLIGDVKTTQTKCTFTGLNNEKAYYATVRPVISTDDFESVSNYYLRITLACKPTKPIEAVCTSIDTATASASFSIAAGKADFYEVEVYTNSGSLVLKDTATSRSCTIRNSALLKPKFYKVRVRSAIELDSGKIYSAYSPYSYFTSLPIAKATRVNGKKVKISWNKNPDAKYYDVYFYATGTDPIRVAKEVKKNKVTLRLNTVRDKSYTIKIVPTIEVKNTVYKSVKDPNGNYSLQVMF